jgi:hypothetical protein
MQTDPFLRPYLYYAEVQLAEHEVTQVNKMKNYAVNTSLLSKNELR